MRISFLIGLISFVCSLNVNSQILISGVVTDSLNNPIPSASVYLSKTTYGVLSDSKGAFAMSIAHDGIYEMIVSCIKTDNERRHENHTFII